MKVHSLKKFIAMKYGLDPREFVVDVIYRNDLIPEDYSLVDIAYAYNWRKDTPMQFFYRIFKKTKVILKRKKKRVKSSESLQVKLLTADIRLFFDNFPPIQLNWSCQFLSFFWNFGLSFFKILLEF